VLGLSRGDQRAAMRCQIEESRGCAGPPGAGHKPTGVARTKGTELAEILLRRHTILRIRRGERGREVSGMCCLQLVINALFYKLSKKGRKPTTRTPSKLHSVDARGPEGLKDIGGREKKRGQEETRGENF